MSTKVKFNKFERTAGLFVVVAMGGLFFSLAGVAVKQGWFDSKTSYKAVFESADGIHNGTAVQMSGLRVGSVENVELRHDNKIEVELLIFTRFSSKIREDSLAMLVRPFIIGERMVEITVGSPDSPEVKAHAVIHSQEGWDLMTMLSGRKIDSALDDMGNMVKNLKFLAQAFTDQERVSNIVKIFDRMEPLLNNMNKMSTEVVKLSRQATKDERFGIVMRELATTTQELNAMLPEMKARAPKMAQDMEILMANLAVLTEQSKVLLPALAEIAPDLPRSSRRAVEALDETVVLLKALQKSFLLRGSADEVRAEEKLRQPAAASPEKAP